MGGPIFQGNFVGLPVTHVDPAIAARPDYLGHFSNSSLAPVKAFIPRVLLRDQIRAQLCDGEANGTTSMLAVWGLGGAGKTQLVLDYVQQYRRQYKATFWIEAGQKESLERDFVNLYQTLFGEHNGAGQETISVDKAVTAVKSWFSGRQGPWLFVFDGADAIDDEKAKGYIAIKHFIPDIPSLHVVITTRTGAAKGMTRLGGVQVGDMEEVQAIDLFCRCSEVQRDDGSIEEVKAIVRELGYLALAITLAGTYVGTTPRLQFDIKAYLPEYRQRRRELLKRKPESILHQYSESVLTTWETSYQAISDSDYPEAADIMTMLSFLSSDDIFLQLFNTGLQTSAKAMSHMDIYKIEDCFRILEKYSFLQWKKDQASFAMHKLVHAWGFDRLEESKQSSFSITVLKLMAAAITGCSSWPDDKLRLVPHVMANFYTVAQPGYISNRIGEEIVDDIESLALFLAEIGWTREEQMLKEFVLSKHHGHLSEAARIQREVLGKWKLILGEEHLNTILTMHNLAVTLGDQGHLSEAARMQREVLEKWRLILGEEHPDTILTMHNLAVTLRRQGHLSEAAQIHREVLEKRRQILGEEHPDTISTTSHLATTLHYQGYSSEAVQTHREVLEKSRRILGEEHPYTLTIMKNLAVTLHNQGYLSEAIQMHREVLENRRRILGEEHPHTINTMNNLAVTLDRFYRPRLLGNVGRRGEGEQESFTV
ncbi:TPR-like protein [Viridothelium virens]|uniref:TPR-like protein n=1 Tax=Viridothelium virens TaxID=1048519 RepID=A0A6A6HAS5_VIRVR|nr:TPR-like protein [Viridothelium virens]